MEEKYLLAEINNSVCFIPLSYVSMYQNDDLSNAVEVSNEIRDQYFSNNVNEKRYAIKNINGTTFEEIFEEIIVTPDNSPKPPTDAERLSALEDAFSTMMGV